MCVKNLYLKYQASTFYNNVVDIILYINTWIIIITLTLISEFQNGCIIYVPNGLVSIALYWNIIKYVNNLVY